MADVTPELLTALAERVAATLTDVWAVYLFGSRARDRQRPDSDIDLAVLGRARFDPVAVFDLGLELGVQAGRDVDLVDVRRGNLVLQKEVVFFGRHLRCPAPAATEAFEQSVREIYYAWLEEDRIAHEQAGLVPPRRHVS